MNIAIFTDTYLPDINGVAASVYTLSQELKKRGHRVYVFTVSEPKSTLKALREDKSSVYRVPSIPIVFLKPHRAASPFSIRLMRLIKKFKIDIIHTQTEFSMGFMAMGASTSYRLPIVHTYHTMYEDYTHYIAKGKLATPAMARQFSKSFCNLASAIIAPTEKTGHFLKEYGVTKPIYVIPTGINFTPFRRDSYSEERILSVKKKLGLDPSWPILLSLGRLAHEKSVDMSIRAMPSVLKRVPNARLLIVGNGPDREALEDLSRELALTENVIFAGAVPYQDVGLYYQLGDLFLCCSITETQGLTYYEAMAAGLPIVARRDECILSVIRDKVEGRIFDSPEEIAAIAEEILRNPEIADNYSRHAQERVAPWSAEVFAARVEDVYTHTIDRKLVAHVQRHDSVIRTPVPSALRHLRLVTARPDHNADYDKKKESANHRRQKHS